MNSLFRVSARNHAGMILMSILAEPDNSGKFVSLKDIAEDMGLSQGFLEEIAAALKKVDLIKGRQGPGGGYQLKKPANKVTAQDILVALEGPIGLVECSGACPVASKCSSKSLWGVLENRMNSMLKMTKLSDIV